MKHRRINEAYSLMTDILASKPVIQPTPSIYSAARPISPRAAAKERAGEKRRKKREREQIYTQGARLPVPVPATVDFKYGLPEKRYKDGKDSAHASDTVKSAKKVQFSSTQGMLHKCGS